MSILGVVVRSRSGDLREIEQSLRALPGIEIAQRADPDDGRLVVVIEDTADRAAAATMAEIARWPKVLSTSLVYEYSGPDAPALTTPVEQYADWRSSPSELTGPAPAPEDTQD